MVMIKIYKEYTHFLIQPTYCTVEQLEKELESFLGHFKTYEKKFVKKFNQYTKKWSMKPVTSLAKVFYINDGLYIRLPIGCIKEFCRALEIKGISYKIEYDVSKENYKPDKIKVKLVGDKKPRDYQQQCIDIITGVDTGNFLIEFPTGTGKTFTSVSCLVKDSNKFGVLVLPKYINKWIDDITSLTNIQKHEIYIMQGKESYIKLFKEKDYRKKYKCYIFPMRSTSNYVQEYERIEGRMNADYPVPPGSLLSELGIGTILNDESHQEFHAMYRIMLMMKPKKLIGMSATFDHNETRIKTLYKIMFPSSTRISNSVDLKIKRYIHVKSTPYKFTSPKSIRCEQSNGYHQVTFEQSIMSRGKTLKQYTDMILHFVYLDYIKRRKQGEKLLIFVGSIDYTRYLVGILKKRYPFLDIRSYVESDNYENIINADISVSTVLSAGTAIDIPNLINVIQTISIGSLQQNQQALGRLRYIPNREVVYRFLYANNLNKHIELKNQRIQCIKDYWGKHTVEPYREIIFSGGNKGFRK